MTNKTYNLADKKFKLVLGSQSPRRKNLLEQLEIYPDTIQPADIDETPKKHERPSKYVERMAIEKLQALIPEFEGKDKTFILTGDTCVSVGRRIIGKAENKDHAKEMLEFLSGRSHQVISSVALYSPIKEKYMHKQSNSRVKFKRLSPKDIKDYLELGQWDGCAGSYQIHGYGGAFVHKIIGSYTGVMGLPIYDTRQMFLSAGFIK